MTNEKKRVARLVMANKMRGLGETGGLSMIWSADMVGVF